eukprot:342724-Pelagomonas_calceolata.AAC.1
MGRYASARRVQVAHNRCDMRSHKWLPAFGLMHKRKVRAGGNCVMRTAHRDPMFNMLLPNTHVGIA